jgi:hypothetical protein
LVIEHFINNLRGQCADWRRRGTPLPRRLLQTASHPSLVETAGNCAQRSPDAPVVSPLPWRSPEQLRRELGRDSPARRSATSLSLLGNL